MPDEIINRVTKSKLETIDVEFFITKMERISFDIKPWLKEELFLVEKDFREKVKNFDWKKYNNKAVFIICSNDAIVPDWAFILVSSQLNNKSIINVIGSKEVLDIKLITDSINTFDFSIYKDKIVIIKGCSDEKIPLSAYSILLEKLQLQAKSIMFGEACSSVPIYKSSNK
tara:strand:+ start:2154 stop:2666 length:513 start_codon:yes stop_codon:yes gene_type:complete